MDMKKRARMNAKCFLSFLIVMLLFSTLIRFGYKCLLTVGERHL